MQINQNQTIYLILETGIYSSACTNIISICKIFITDNDTSEPEHRFPDHKDIFYNKKKLVYL